MLVFSSIQIRRGTQLLLDNACATINPGQKVGLVGKNGCGKSTLFSLIKGELSLDAGSMQLPAHWQLAWVNQETPALDKSAIEYVIDGDQQYRQLQAQLAQATEANDGNRIALLHEQLETIDGWTIQARAATLLHGLGFQTEQHQLPVKAFSGGWRMRLNLAQALLCRSDLLLLDEPTNHLDLDAVIWLERWLTNYRGTLLLISHDRDFLDPLVNKIIHIENQQLIEYSGNYSDFESMRAMKLAQQQSLYQHQQQKIAHLQSYVDRFRAKATKARQAQSRLKMLERMEKIAPAHVDSPFQFHFAAADSLPNPILSMQHVQAGYGEKTVLQQIKLNLVPGSRIGLLGRNGAGKSTLIKLLAGELPAQAGEVNLSKGIKLGYFAQHQLETLRSEASALWHLQQLAEPQITEQQLRNYLGGFNFSGDKVTQAVGCFSGGEKARLVLALIVWQRPNLLLLDEPTNHLDLEMRQALTEALIDYEGAMMIVSHDRHLLRATTDEFYLVHDGKAEPFAGDLQDYQRWLLDEQKQQSAAVSPAAATESARATAQDRKAQKRQQAELRAQTQPLRIKLADYEQQLAQLEQQLSQIEAKLSDPELYQAEQKSALTALLLEQSGAKKQQEEAELAWLDLQQQLDEIMGEA